MKQTTVARAIMQAVDAHARPLLKAVETLYGPTALAWEPETLRMEADEDGLAVPDQNWDMIFASMALKMADAFFWDATVFAHTCLVLNQFPATLSTIPQLTPPQMCWGIEEALRIADIPRELSIGDIFDREPTAYVAVACRESGNHVLPTTLSFAQELSNAIAAHPFEDGERVRAAWGEMDKTPSVLKNSALSEDVVGVQLAHLASCTLYCAEKRAEVEAQLNFFRA